MYYFSHIKLVRSMVLPITVYYRQYLVLKFIINIITRSVYREVRVNINCKL